MSTVETPMTRTVGAEGDVDLIVNERFFRDLGFGVMLEVGAANPNYLSVGAQYRSMGWKVISIEPNPAYQPLYEEKGYKVLQYACGDSDVDDVDFSVVDSTGIDYRGGNLSFESWSSIEIKDDYKSLKPDIEVKHIKVKMRRIDTILAEHHPEVDAIDLVSIDIEGWELEALAGMSFERFKPKVLIVENLFYYASYRQFMSERGYELWRIIPPNEIYVRSDLIGTSERAMRLAPNVAMTALMRSRVQLGRLKRGVW